jgi:hypothetical protein
MRYAMTQAGETTTGSAGEQPDQGIPSPASTERQAPERTNIRSRLGHIVFPEMPKYLRKLTERVTYIESRFVGFTLNQYIFLVQRALVRSYNESFRNGAIRRIVKEIDIASKGLEVRIARRPSYSMGPR